MKTDETLPVVEPSKIHACPSCGDTLLVDLVTGWRLCKIEGKRFDL